MTRTDKTWIDISPEELEAALRKVYNIPEGYKAIVRWKTTGDSPTLPWVRLEIHTHTPSK